ncbi:phosphopantetheine-binding protein [Martelella alba]|uniref:Acyl carrier protein n=1 Tax=Martelella alba TaxID=2590451 RepID=A0ABY2SGA2_9HYPH|nr:acyl carrier protein [Martelella alba]
MDRNTIREIIHKHIDTKADRDDDDFFKSGMLTSYQLVRIYHQIEKDTGIIIPLDTILTYHPRTINQLTDMFLSVLKGNHE